MYGLPTDDLTFLEGTRLLQVCIGSNEVILNFDREVSITIESTFRVRSSEGEDIVFENSPSSAAALAELLSERVTEVHGQTDGTLRLLFSRGAVLEIYDSSKNYESYQVRHGQVQYIV